LIPVDRTDVTCGKADPNTDIQNLPLVTRMLDRNEHNVWITCLWRSIMTNSLGGAPKKRQKVLDELGKVGIDISIGGQAYWKQLLKHVQDWEDCFDYRNGQIQAPDNKRKGPWDIGHMRSFNVFQDTIWAVPPEIREPNWLPENRFTDMNEQYRTPPPLALAARFAHGWLKWAAAFWNGDVNEDSATEEMRNARDVLMCHAAVAHALQVAWPYLPLALPSMPPIAQQRTDVLHNDLYQELTRKFHLHNEDRSFEWLWPTWEGSGITQPINAVSVFNIRETATRYFSERR
jgi:hypothetical protein